MAHQELEIYLDGPLHLAPGFHHDPNMFSHDLSSLVEKEYQVGRYIKKHPRMTFAGVAVPTVGLAVCLGIAIIKARGKSRATNSRLRFAH